MLVEVFKISSRFAAQVSRDPLGGVTNSMTYPKQYNADSAPRKIVALVARLLPGLLGGQHLVHSVLLEQFGRASIKEVEMTGVGFYVEFDTPDDVPLAVPRNFAGGSAEIALEGAPAGAGCVLFVCEGRLATLEGFTYGSEEWAEDARVLSVENIEPVYPDDAA